MYPEHPDSPYPSVPHSVQHSPTRQGFHRPPTHLRTLFAKRHFRERRSTRHLRKMHCDVDESFFASKLAPVDDAEVVGLTDVSDADRKEDEVRVRVTGRARLRRHCDEVAWPRMLFQPELVEFFVLARDAGHARAISLGALDEELANGHESGDATDGQLPAREIDARGLLSEILPPAEDGTDDILKNVPSTSDAQPATKTKTTKANTKKPAVNIQKREPISLGPLVSSIVGDLINKVYSQSSKRSLNVLD
ncbi:hypothetical protein BD410DRAFT_808938 [Rickenella mellea]|uniref:Uncharacterized protein n=1 Tax=Rickenella mellea TaxID=50990 RepID=A0A4Y7PLH0_9AGAM|nr:hypothetical protein BD410DRAFT_808938 [Rickenella mellea]